MHNENKKCLYLSFVSTDSSGVGRTGFGAAGIGQRQGVQALRELSHDEFGRFELAGFPLGMFWRAHSVCSRAGVLLLATTALKRLSP